MEWNNHQPGVDLQDKRTKPRKHRDSQFDQYKDIRKEHQRRLRTGPGKPVKSWNFILASPGKRPLVVVNISGNQLNPTKKYKVYGRQ